MASAVYDQLVQAGDAVVFMRQSHLTLQASPVSHWSGPSLLELGLPRLTCKVPPTVEKCSNFNTNWMCTCVLICGLRVQASAGPLQLNGQFDPATAVPALLLLFDERLVAVVQVLDRPVS